jgi:hypothetical protein
MHEPSFPNQRLICAGTGYNLRAPDLFGLWLSLARAPRSGRGGRGFESHQPDHLASSRSGTDSPQRHRGHEGVHEEGVVIKKMATHTKPPRIDLRRLNLCDLCALLCGPCFVRWSEISRRNNLLKIGGICGSNFGIWAVVKSVASSGFGVPRSSHAAPTIHPDANSNAFPPFVSSAPLW